MARVGAARIFFDVVGSFQAEKFITQTRQGMLAYRNITTSILIDTMTAVSDSVLLFAEAFQSVLDNTVSLATNVSLARIEFEKFAGGIEGVRLEEMQKDLRDLGEEFAFTAEQSFNAGARMSQLSGILKSQEAILAATKGSLQFGFVGGMTSETAAQRMIQLHAQTNFMFGENTQAQYDLMTAQQQADVVTENLTKTISGLNTIENRSAATMAQLTFVMNQFAASAMLAGDSIEQMAAMSAVLIEAGEEQGKAGRALRMIYARLGADTSDNNQILERYVGTIRDANGDLLPLSVILGKLAVRYDDLSSAEKNAIAQAVAGNDHYVRFLKLMEGYDRSVTLATQASQGLDSVVEEMELFTGDPSFQLKILQAELENVREEMGQNLTPIVIGQTKAQVAMTQANADLIATLVDLGEALGISGGGVALAFAQLTELTNNLARGFNNYINIKNMSVALQTQLLIMQAITGEDFIQAQGAERQNRIQADINHILDRQVQIKAAISQLDKQEREQNEIKLQQLLRIQNAEVKIAELVGKEANEILKLGVLGAQALNNQELRNFAADIHLQRQKEITKELKAQLNLESERFNLSGMLKAFQMDDGRLSSGKVQELNKLIPLLERNNQLQKEDLGLMEAKLMRAQLKQATDAKESDIRQKKIDSLEMDIETSKQEIAHNDRLIIQGRQLIDIFNAEKAARDSGAFSEHQLTFIRQMLVAENLELLLATDDLSEAERELVLIFQQAEQEGKSLADTMHEIAMAKADAGRATEKLGKDSKKSKEEMSLFNEELDRVNLTMNGLTMGAGLASTAITIFGGVAGLDKRESAAAAMAAMHLSMIPNIISMVEMQRQMLIAAGAATNFSQSLQMVLGPMGIAFAAVGLMSLILGTYSARKQQAAAAEQEHAAALAMSNKQLLGQAAALDRATVEDASRTNVGIMAEIRADEDRLAVLSAKETLNSLEELDKQQIESRIQTNKALLLARAGLALGDEKITQSMINFGEQGLTGFQENMDFFAEKTDESIAAAEEAFNRFGEGNYGADYPLKQDIMENNIATLAQLAATGKDFDELGEDLQLFFMLFEMGFLDANSTVADFVAIVNSVPPELRDSTTDIANQFDEMESSITGFSSALEEFYYGGQISMATGDLLKQVVQKGAENLIQNTELIMTNNFYGLTLPEMVDTISNAVTDQLVQQGIVQSSGMAT